MTALHAQVIDQHIAFDRVALIENVFIDRPWSADAALRGDVAQLSVQILLTQGRSLSVEGRRQQNGSGGNDKAQHETLLGQ
ncbi:hypothetical protein D9M71_818140 [compost metagenome]